MSKQPILDGVTRRLATTLMLAILYLLVAELVPLPSVDPDAMGLTFGHRHMVGVLAVGITPGHLRVRARRSDRVPLCRGGRVFGTTTPRVVRGSIAP